MSVTGPVELESLIRNSLEEFAAHLNAVPWVGKEHDCVNRFAHGFLIPRCQAGTALNHPTQVGIEVPVAQPPGVGVKAAARKDLVVWPQAWMSCYDTKWRPIHHPLVVMEWKTTRDGFRFDGTEHDHSWLSAFTSWRPETLGLSVVVSVGEQQQSRLRATRFLRGEALTEWLVIARAP